MSTDCMTEWLWTPYSLIHLHMMMECLDMVEPATMVQVFVGVETRLTEAYPMTSESQMSQTLQDFIRQPTMVHLTC